MVSHRQVAGNYFNAYDRAHYNRGSSMYFEDDTLYSYGSHFILAQKVKNGYILNGDKYSNSTAKHQSITRGETPNSSPIIPYSALMQILKTKNRVTVDREEIAKITIIDVTADTYVKYTTYDKDGKPYEAERHMLGASLIKYRSKYYLSSIDQGSKNWGAYFLVELPKSEGNIAPTVENAFRLLAGNLTDGEYNKYLTGEVKRQGEYFLIPVKYTTRQLKTMGAITPRKIKKHVDLSKRRGNAHIARDSIKTSAGLFIRGTLRHTEHKMISFKNIWHKIIKNTAKKSFTATGNVD